MINKKIKTGIDSIEGIKSMNLQLFADDKGDDDKQDTPPDNDGGTDNKDNDDDKTFTQAELDDIIKDRLARADEKNKKNQQDAIAKALEDAKAKWDKDKDFQKSLADMNDDDKVKALQDKKLNDLEEKEAELRQRELLIDTNEMLVEKDIPKEFATILIGEDEATTKDNVNNFHELTKAYIDDAVSKGVQKAISTRTPGGSGGVARDEKGSHGKALARQSNTNANKDHQYFD